MDSLYNTIYSGNKPGSEQIYTHAETLDNKDMVIEHCRKQKLPKPTLPNRTEPIC